MKKLFWAALLPIAFTACTNDELAVMEAPETEGNMITLDENFALGFTKDAGFETRAQLQGADGKLKFHWLPELDGGTTPIVDEIGLAWVGPTAGTEVYTNYLFKHFAWPANGATPSIDECTNEWHNLVFLNEADYVANGSSDKSTYVTSGSWIINATSKLVEFTTADAGITANTQGAYFNTENLTIFGGDYIAYSPYDEDLVDVGNLIAKSKTSFTGVVPYDGEGTWTAGLQGIANDAFYVGVVPNLRGGTMANGFKLTAVSGYLKLRLNAHAGTTWSKIKNVAIYSKDGIVYEQAIDASKVAAAQAGNMASCLIDGTQKTKSLINAELNANLTITAPADKPKYMYINIPVLPQTITNASVVLIAEDGVNVRIPVAGNIEVQSNKEVLVDVPLVADKPMTSDQFYVVDMPTFRVAMVKAGTAPGGKVTVELLDDIIYDHMYTDGGSGKIIVNRDMDIIGGTITVPANEKLTLALVNPAPDKEITLTMEKDFIINGADKCTDCNAEVKIYSQTGKATFNFGGNVIVPKSAKLLIHSNAWSTTNVNIADDKTLTNDGLVDIYANSNLTVDNFVNNNEVTMRKKDINTKNTVTVGTLTNADEATWSVDAYTTLTIEEALNNDGTLDIASSKTGSNATDGTVQINSGATSTNNGTISNQGVYNNEGTTALNDGSQFIDYVGSQYGVNMPTLTEKAEYICLVNTSDKTNGDRLGYALDSKMKTTTVKFISNATHTYQLSEYSSYDKLAKVNYIIDVDGANFDFNNNTVNQIDLGGNITVEDVATLTFRNSAQGTIKVGKDLDVEDATLVRFIKGVTAFGGDVNVAAGEIYNAGGGSAAIVNVGGNVDLTNAIMTVKALDGAVSATQHTTDSWTVTGNVSLNGTSTMKVNTNAAAEITGNLTIGKGTSALFDYSSYTNVTGTITNDGTFTRVLSSGSDTANPAEVWCGLWVKNAGSTVVNAGPKVNK